MAKLAFVGFGPTPKVCGQKVLSDQQTTSLDSGRLAKCGKKFLETSHLFLPKSEESEASNLAPPPHFISWDHFNKRDRITGMCVFVFCLICNRTKQWQNSISYGASFLRSLDNIIGHPDKFTLGAASYFFF